MILSRPLLQPQERFDLEDFNALLAAGRTDAQLYAKNITSAQNYVLQGFPVSGIGLKQATVVMTNATLLIPQSSADFSWFTAEPGASPVIIPEGSITPGVRNYIEIQLTTQHNTLVTRAFWDPSANGGAGAEFNQIVNTITDLQAVFVVLTGGFSGSPDSLPLAIMDVDGSNNIQTILDRRNLFFRLSLPTNLDNGYAWGTKSEPSYALTLNSETGTFVVGETITIGSEQATVTVGGTTSISFNAPTGINFFPGSSVTGLTSGATGTVATVLEAFTGVDKSILSHKNLFDAMMTEIRYLKGTRFWWQTPAATIPSIMGFLNGVFVPAPAANQPLVAWDGSNLKITDSNLSPSSSDPMAFIRIFGNPNIYTLLRADGQAGTSTIPIADGQVMFVTLPTSGSQSYSGNGSGASNYQVAARASFIPNGQNYWLAYREGSKLIMRWTELDIDQEAIIGYPTLDQNLKLVDGGDWSWSTGGGGAGVIAQNLAINTGVFVGGSTLTWTGQSFTTTGAGNIDTATFQLKYSIPGFSGNMTAQIYADSIGSPGTPGVLLGTSLPFDTSTLTNIFQTVVFTFSSPVAVAGSTMYHVVLNGSAMTWGSGQMQAEGDSPSSYSGGTEVLTTDGGSTWNPQPTIDLYFIIHSSGVSSGILTWSANAYIQVPGLNQTRNTILAGMATLTTDGQCAYVNISRSNGSPLNLTPIVADISAVPSGNTVFIIARRTVNNILIGNSFNLINGQSKILDAGLSDQTQTLIGGSGIPITEATSATQFSVRGAPQRAILDSDSILDAQANNDAELDKFFGQFRLKAQGSPNQHVTVTSSDVTMRTGEVRSQVVSNLLAQPGAYDINFQTGVITPNGANFTPIIPSAGMFRWASIGVLPFSTTSDLRINLQILVIFGSSDGSSPSLAPKAPFSSSALNLGEVVLTSADGINISNIVQSALVQLGTGSGSGGTGSGSGLGDDLDSLTYRASFFDQLTDLPSSALSAIDFSAGKTNPTNFSIVNHYIRMAYDASKTIAASTTATHILLSSAASYTVAVGDIVRILGQARRIITVNSQSDFVVEGSGFSPVPTLGQQVTVSQASYTKDLNNYVGSGQAISASFTDNINDVLVQYGDSATLNDQVPDWNLTPEVAYDVSSSGVGNMSDVAVRAQGFINSEQVTVIPTPGTNLFLRFFSNAISGSGFVNLLDYRVFFHRDETSDFAQGTAEFSGRTDGAGTSVNCVVDNSGAFTVISGLPTYSVGINPGTIFSQWAFYLNGQKLPRFLDATSTPGAWFSEIDGNSIRLDKKYDTFAFEFEGIKSAGTIDVTDSNVTRISALEQSENQSFFASSDVTTASSTISTGPAFTTFSNSPAFSITPLKTGKYKIYSSVVIEGAVGGDVLLRIFNTSGGATLFKEQQAAASITSGSAFDDTLPIQSVYTLTAGVTYVFDIQGSITGSATVNIRGDVAPFCMLAERVGS